VSSPEHAVERLNTYVPDVIVFNTVMDHEQKEAWMARIRETLADARILDVSNEKNARASGVIGASLDGAAADAVLGLPFPEGRLLEAIDRLLAGERARA
jgi:hypothetical protein